ncbi:MAG: hypothetical protein SFZ24_04235 [Planctomycetota bacterium]|nr:hypothetical protein [Planctomycetota bacterium]
MKHVAARVKLLVAADKRKAATLGGLVLVLGLLVVKNAVFSGPARATAESESADGIVGPDDAGRDAVSRTMAALGGSGRGPVVKLAAPSRLGRDVFALDPAHFPLASQSSEAESDESSEVAGPVESVRVNADVPVASREEELRAEVRGWRLRSVLLSRQAAAVLELGGDQTKRTVVLEGQSVRGWTLSEVEKGSVVVEREGVRVRLEIETPDR